MIFFRLLLVNVLLSGAATASTWLPSLARPLDESPIEAVDMRYRLGNEWGEIPC